MRSCRVTSTCCAPRFVPRPVSRFSRAFRIRSRSTRIRRQDRSAGDSGFAVESCERIGRAARCPPRYRCSIRPVLSPNESRCKP
jgi:hypothetical protein